MKNKPVESRIKSLRLPGDPSDGLDREVIREQFARGEGLDPRKLTIYKDNESLLDLIQERQVFTPTDGNQDLEEVLAKLDATMEEKARSGHIEPRSEIPAPQASESEEDDRKEKPKAPLWKRILKPDDETSEPAVSDSSQESTTAQHGDVSSETVDRPELQRLEAEAFTPVDIEPEYSAYQNRPDDVRASETSTEVFDQGSGVASFVGEDSSSTDDRAEADVAINHDSQDTARFRAQESARFTTHEIARINTDERVEGPRPTIRRIETKREAPPPMDYGSVEEGTAVFLSLAASQSDSISGTVTAPVSEPAVTMATSRLPKITSDHLQRTSPHKRVPLESGDHIDEMDDVNEELFGEAPKSRKSRIDHLTKSTLILIVGLILSKLTGQLRQVLYPHVFVQKHLTDAYVQGFLIPDFIYELLVGGSIQAAIVPTLASALGTKDERKTWHSVSVFISFVSLIMLFTLVLAEVFTPQLLAPFVKAENLELTTRMARVLFPQTFFMMGAALSIGIINAYSNFLKTSFGPAIYNSLFAASLLILGTSSEQGLINVGIGVSLSALVYFLFQIFLGRKEVSPYRFRLNLRDKGFRTLLLLAVPILFSSSIAHLNTMVLHGFTKTMAAGAATALNQANSVWLLPYGIFTVAIGQAMLPTLSTMIGREREDAASSLFSASIRRMLFFAIPSAITFFILREDLMLGIFIWRFEGYEAQIEVTRLAARLLQWYCISIIVQGFIYLYNYAFYAMKVTYLPLINGLLSLGLTLAVGSYITQPHVLGAEGLSVSYALSGTMTALILGVLFKIRFKDLAPKFFTKEWGSFFLKLIPMTAVMVGALYGLETYLQPEVLDGKIQQLIWLGLRFAVAFGLWLIGGKLLKVDLKIDPHIPKESI